MPASTTSSYIYRSGTSPNTRSAISQKNKIFGYSVGNSPGFTQIGAVTEFGHDESKSLETVRGIGFGDMIAELVPTVTEAMTLTLNKTLLYTANLFQVVGYKGGMDGLVRSLKHHRWPFDLKQELVFSEVALAFDGSGPELGQATVDIGGVPSPVGTIQALFTYYEGCWFNSYSTSYTSDAALVSENSSITVTDVIDGISSYGEYIDTGLAPVSPGAPGKGFSLRFSGGSQAPQV